MKLSVKLGNQYWQPHAAEFTAGYYNSEKHNAYLDFMEELG
jgi:hypothetical protein